jgi:hypothetical protein
MSTELLTNGYMICQLVIILLGIWCLVVKDQAEPVYLVIFDIYFDASIFKKG